MGFSASARKGLDFGVEQNLLGVTDFDLYPESVAKRIVADDQKVTESRQPLLNIVELLVNPSCGAIGWYVTNKFPVFDQQGDVIGVMGTVQPYEGRRTPFAERFVRSKTWAQSVARRQVAFDTTSRSLLATSQAPPESVVQVVAPTCRRFRPAH